VSIFRHYCLFMPLSVLLFAGSTGSESVDSTVNGDRERNRQLLQKWKNDPEHFARLQRDLSDFWSMPDAKRRKIRELDAAFHELDTQTQKRLWKVADRYVEWLENLSEEERQRIEESNNSIERLGLIRSIRERQWIEGLPRNLREDLQKLPQEERANQVAQLREQERQQKIQWRKPIRIADRSRQPTRLADLPGAAKDFVEKHLLPHLNAEERRRYDAAQGHWPDFVDTIKELAKSHPVLPPLSKPITHYDQLPEKAKIEAGPKTIWEKREEVWQELQRVEGKWPEWATTFLRHLSPEQRKHMPPLGASRPGEFPPKAREFINKTLSQKVTVQERRELRALEGKWPDYPLRLLRLAEKYKLEVPGMSLPVSADW
jgi:hypothetical protein